MRQESQRRKLRYLDDAWENRSDYVHRENYLQKMDSTSVRCLSFEKLQSSNSTLKNEGILDWRSWRWKFSMKMQREELSKLSLHTCRETENSRNWKRWINYIRNHQSCPLHWSSISTMISSSESKCWWKKFMKVEKERTKNWCLLTGIDIRLVRCETRAYPTD